MFRLKSEILRLLREDEEFRYAVAGLIGLEEILKKLDRHEEQLVKLREDMNIILKRLDRHEEELVRHRKELVRLREDMNKVLERLDRHEEELVRHGEELIRLREDMNRLREDMIRGFELVNRHISALGARWGLIAEEAFREGLRGVLEKELGLKVEKWTHFDQKGLVYGYPSQVEIDIAIKDEKLILIEVASHVKTSDIYEFKRKAELYEKVTGKRPDRLLIVTPYAEQKAIEAAKRHGVEVYTKV